MQTAVKVALRAAATQRHLLTTATTITIRTGHGRATLASLGGCVQRHLTTEVGAASESSRRSNEILEAIPHDLHTARIVFNNSTTYEFKYIWLRDNCHCERCVHPVTRQKLVDSPALNINTAPVSIALDTRGQLVVHWSEGGSGSSGDGGSGGDGEGREQPHVSVYDPEWLHKHGQCFAHDTFDTLPHVQRPAPKLWNQQTIREDFPEVSYCDMMTSDDGLFRWLDYIHKYGLAFLRGVPLNKDEIIKVVQRFAYVKQTSYGITFDVVNEPDPEAHLAFTGVHLDHHTDMNYREKSPGLQLLHCMKADVLSGEELENVGGESFFVDGFAIANWLRETHPAAFHVLTSTAVKFCIVNKGHRYSQKVPIICVDKAGDIEEVHVNNRTMGPLQVPSHLVLPFYHAYKILTNKIRDGSHELRFHMQPKDLVLFNNRRALHGRTQFDPSKISRHLIGCYTDSDEMMSKYDSFLIGSH